MEAKLGVPLPPAREGELISSAGGAIGTVVLEMRDRLLGLGLLAAGCTVAAAGCTDRSLGIFPDAGSHPDGGSNHNAAWCGNDQRDGDERCDGVDHGGQDCVSLGYASGALGCTAQCQFDASGCVSLADCGNGFCDGDQGETHGNCPQDCLGYVVLAAAAYHTCAVSTGGTAWCWGAGSYGQHGNGLWWEATSRPTGVSGGLSVTDIAAGSGGLDRGHGCAVASDGTVWCWGAGGDGQLGNGSRADSGVPVPVAGITNAVAISAGDRFSCALTAEGTVWCWGSGRHGALGNGAESDSLTPVPVTSLADVRSLASGGSYTHGGHSCVVASDGTVWCWGGGSYGQLGDGSTFDASTPVQVMGLPDVAMVSAGVTHSCAVATEGTAWCWGEGMFGKLGNGSESDASTPLQVAGLPSSAVIAAGGGHTCAVASEGTAWCWGAGDSGGLGNGDLVDSPTPVQVADLSGLRDLHAGDGHTCAVASEGMAWCWGWGAEGQLGDARQLGIDWPSYSDTPVQVTPPF